MRSIIVECMESKYKIIHKRKQSETFSIDVVRQKCIISPSLFIIIMNKIMSNIRNKRDRLCDSSKMGVKINKDETKLMTIYADCK